MMQLFLIIILQIVFALGVVIFLKSKLDKELQLAAIEMLYSLRSTDKVNKIIVYHTQGLSEELKNQIESFVMSKFPNVICMFELEEPLKGGLKLSIGEDVFDFSITNRLRNFWS